MKHPHIARICVLSVLVASAVAGTGSARSQPLGSAGLATDGFAQMQAEEAWRILREQWVYDAAGRWLGRIIGVKVGEGGALMAIIRARPAQRGRRYLVPVSSLARVKGHLVLTTPVPR